MEVLVIALVSGLSFIVAYHTYGKWLGSKIFRLSADMVCPSHRLRDDVDYIPTSKTVVFGHHFTSIAGTGPIVGPAIAILWGWLPALLWVVLGSIFIGAVHDFGALVVSLRNDGQTVGDVAGRVLNKRVRFLFLFTLFLALTIVLAIFGLVIAAVFKMFPTAIFPCMIQIPLAVIIGVCLHRKGGGLFWSSFAALAFMYLSVVYGNVGILAQVNSAMAAWPIWGWVLFLMVYSYLASILPVWSLLQPRDYINSLQLLSSLGLIVLGLVVAAFAGGAAVGNAPRPELTMAAPMIQWHPKGAPAMLPFLFITIACGAISGFHCLVSSGTSSKQLNSESDARFVGYGAMLTEGFFATLVLLACAAGLGLGLVKDGAVLTGAEAWSARYASWNAAEGLGSKVGAFVEGSANFLQALFSHVDFSFLPTWILPGTITAEGVSVALMGVLVASFAGTTLDTACRLQRYIIQELAVALGSSSRPASSSSKPALFPPFAFLANKHGATLFAVGVAMFLAAVPPSGAAWSLANAGKGGMVLWPLFGATNQLLGGLSFLVIAFFLWRRRKPIWFLILPGLFMLVMPFWAMWSQIFFGSGAKASWISSGSWHLVLFGVMTLALEIWIFVEALLLFPKVKGILEPGASDSLPQRQKA